MAGWYSLDFHSSLPSLAWLGGVRGGKGQSVFPRERRGHGETAAPTTAALPGSSGVPASRSDARVTAPTLSLLWGTFLRQHYPSQPLPLVVSMSSVPFLSPRPVLAQAPSLPLQPPWCSVRHMSRCWAASGICLSYPDKAMDSPCSHAQLDEAVSRYSPASQASMLSSQESLLSIHPLPSHTHTIIVTAQPFTPRSPLTAAKVLPSQRTSGRTTF